MSLGAYRIDWTEYERGWGQRPDGSTLHLTKEDADAYIKEYWDGMPDRSLGVPDEYSAPGTPRFVEATVEQIELITMSPKRAIWIK